MKSLSGGRSAASERAGDSRGSGRGRGFKRGSSQIPSLRMAARLAPLLPQIWHQGSAGHWGAASRVLAPVPQQSENRRLIWLLLPRAATRCRPGGGRERREKGPTGADNFINLRLWWTKRQSEPQTPARAGGPRGRTGREVIRGTRGFHASWPDLPIENIIAFDFYKYQG